MSVTSRPARSIAGHHLRQGRDVAAGEDVFGDPRIGDAGAFRAADRVQQHHAVVGEQFGALAEERVVVTDADMLEHADRDDAVETLRDVAVVLQGNSTRPPSPFSSARLRASASCSSESVTPVTSAPHVSAR